MNYRKTIKKVVGWSFLFVGGAYVVGFIAVVTGLAPPTNAPIGVSMALAGLLIYLGVKWVFGPRRWVNYLFLAMSIYGLLSAIAFDAVITSVAGVNPSTIGYDLGFVFWPIITTYLAIRWLRKS